MWEISKEFRAMVVFAEHRYYGDSMPYGNDSFNDKKKLGYLTSQQAIADFVDVINHLREDSALNRRRPNPVIAFGGSYGGMLAAWLRMKYPAAVEGSV
jgi:lysosomal Pro-X carboxypeptidase